MKKIERDRFNNFPHEQQVLRQPELLADIAYQLTQANEYRESALTVERAKVEQLEKCVAQLKNTNFLTVKKAEAEGIWTVGKSKPDAPSCNELRTAVEDALRMSALADRTKMEKGCVCKFCAGHHKKLTEALSASPCQPDERAEKLATAVKTILDSDYSYDKNHRLAAIHTTLQSAIDAYRKGAGHE